MKIFYQALYHDYDLNVGKLRVNQFNFKFLVVNVFLEQFQIKSDDSQLPLNLQPKIVEMQLKIY